MIIQSKEIWLSNSKKMNDHHETIWINHLIDDKIKEISDDKYKNFISLMVQTYNINNSIPYIACFSGNGDVLSQWKSYADDGLGVAIGFSTEALNVDVKSPITTTSITKKDNIGLQPVLYEIDEQKNIISGILQHYLLQLDEQTIDENLASLECAILLRRYSVIFKNHTFYDEQEWRIIHTPTLELLLNIFLHVNISDIFFRTCNNDIISYFKLKFDEPINSNLIPEIVLGPKYKLEQYDFEMYLRKNGLNNTKITFSNSTYR